MTQHHPLADLRSALLTFALTLPEAYLDHPWGEDVVKVNKKIFVFLGSDDPQYGGLLGVKLPLSAAGVLMHDFAEPSGYGLGKSGWVSIRHDRGELPPVEVMQDWVEESYRAVAPKGLVKRLVAQADGSPSTEASPTA
ncbi:MAG: MmcQ/YjbR family DNA-binding protein [Anaerolineae bacterium]